MTHLTADDTPNIEEPSASHAGNSLLNLLRALREQLLAHCDTEEELRTLCADLGVNYDDLEATGRANKARELVAWLDRHDRVADLQAILAKPRPFSPVITDYLAAVRDYCANLPYLTLHDIRPPKTLDEVYVSLKARPQPRRDKKPRYDEERALRELELSEPLSIAEVMHKHDPPHVLILGDPGAGKSTLLRQLAEHAWDAPDKIGLDAPHLPILVRLRRLASAEGALEDRLNRALIAELTLTQALPQGFFTNWAKQTRANWLILLDALDEVPSEQRPQLMQWLKGLLNRIGQNRVVLTSRPSGYLRQGELDDKLFGHYDLLSFTPDQTGEFARKWFQPCEDSEPSQDSAEQFLKELERVRAGALSGTPLLLTIAAKVYSEKGTLPERRSGLYGQFIDIWLSEAEQRGLRAELGDAVCDVAKFALARLALAMTEQPMQPEASLSKVAADCLRDAVPLTPERAEIAGERFLKVMARRSGVFTRRGDAYDFIHPTFREYLAAWDAVLECKRNNKYDPKKAWQQIASRWMDVSRREIVLFTLGILSDQETDVTSLVRRVWPGSLLRLICDTDMERLYFAAMVLAERVRVEKSLFDSIIDRLRVLARDEKVSDLEHFSAAEALARLGWSDDLRRLARDPQMEVLSTLVGEALAKWGRADDLLALAHDIQVHQDVCIQIVDTLGDLGRADDLLMLVRDENMFRPRWMRQRAGGKLGRLGRADDLLALARDQKVDPGVRMDAVSVLGRLGRANSLLALARDEKVQEWEREWTIQTLGRFLGRFADAGILPALEQIARKDTSQGVREAAQLVITQIRERTEHNHADTRTTLPHQN